MAQDNTPAIVMYKGPQEDGYSIPFDKGYYGEVKVAFVRRGLTDYEYMPTTYTVDGALYAWEISAGVYYYTKSASPAVDATVYNFGNQEISGVKVVSTQNASASFSDGQTGIRSNKKDIHSHALLFWTGEPLGDDDWICIVRETVKKQPYSYPNNQKHIEGALDNLSRQIQELKVQSDVSLKIDPTFVQDPQKMTPIDWLNTIVRSTDGTARGLRYRNFWLEYSTDDPNKAESDKSWAKLLNTTNITTVRQLHNEEKNEYCFQYSMDGGASWLSVGLSRAEIDKILDEANAYSDEQNAVLEGKIDGKLTAVNAQIDANADAIQKTRSELQTQITAQAAEIATKQDQLTAGDNITIVDNVISATGGGGGGGGIANVIHDATLTGSGTNASPLGLAEAIKDEIADKAPKETVEALTQIVNGIIGDYVKKSGDTMLGGLTLPELTVRTAEGEFYISVVAGVVTIATNNGLDFASHVKFDHAPTTDDNTTWENALGVSLVRKAQVATVTNRLRTDQDTLYGHLLTLRDMLNVKGEDGEWVKLTTEAQEAIPAINELNAKIGEGGGTKVIIKRYE